MATRQSDPQAPSGSGTPYGESGFLSSASSWDMPVGSRIESDSVAGYYIDFRSKVRDPSWPPPWLAPPERQIQVETAQWGLGCFEAHLHTGEERWLEAAAGAAGYLASLLSERGELVHGTPLGHTYPLDPPWLSAMAQGEAASLMVRVYLATGDDALATKARSALEPMRRESSDGGAMANLGGLPFPEEYPTQPPSLVLNGGIFAIWGYRDVGLGLKDDRANGWFDEAASCLIGNLHRWDAGYWSRYDLFPHPVPNIASAGYHTLHIDQLEAFNLVRSDPELTATIERWRGYRDSRWCRSRAFAAKAAFRVLVPRNRFLASRLPTSARSRRAS